MLSVYSGQRPLLDMCFENIFSQYVSCIFIFLFDVIGIVKVLNFNEAQFISIFLLWTMLLISCLRNLCVTQRLEIFLCFHLKVFCFGT